VALHKIGALDDYPPGAIRSISVRGRPVAVIHWRHKVFAVRDVCPHMGGPVCGTVGPQLAAAGVGRITSNLATPVLRCAWHGWEFDLGSCRSVTDSRMRLISYPVVLRDGEVLIETGTD
jgi:3-phenylpropionate/trans-cinnamate dioxygenase ferredoxin subunit